MSFLSSDFCSPDPMALSILLVVLGLQVSPALCQKELSLLNFLHNMLLLKIDSEGGCVGLQENNWIRVQRQL